MEVYRPGRETNNEFFTGCNPDMIEHFLNTYLNEQSHLLKNGASDIKFSNDTYKVKFSWATPFHNQDLGDEVTKIQVRILKVEGQERKFCVEITKLAGNLMTF